MHWVALYPSSSIKSSASKARTPYDSICAYIPETPSLGAEVTVHCPCQVSEACQGLPRTPSLQSQAPMIAPMLTPTAQLGTSSASARARQVPRRAEPSGLAHQPG